MDISYAWLREVAPGIELSPDEAAERLADRGAPVERMDRPGKGLDDLVVGRVEEVMEHPNADRLRLCRVHDGQEVVQVVCGAPNVEAGTLYPFAPVGAELPGGMAIRKAKIRGEESQGMLCSERELGLGEDHEGIMALPGDFQPGLPLVEALGLDDVRMDVEVTPNRGDLLSHVGVARELHPEGDRGIRLPAIPGGGALDLELVSDPEEVEVGDLTIRIQDPDLCSRYLGAVIRGVEVGPSPEWLAARLRSVGARPINNVVDATNYVLRELGQPLHAFDLERLAGRTVVVRRARDGEPIRTLDGEERALGPDMLAICDAREPVAIAGVMGGEDSEVSEETTEILLECALFDPAATRATRRALGMSTDASYRFERGVDPEGLERALGRAVEIILAVAGGEVEPRVADVRPRPWQGLEVGLRPSRVEKVLGVPVPEDEIRALLEPLGFEFGSGEEGALTVSVPGYRSYDVRREVDLIEEVARLRGYDSFPAELGAFRPGSVPDDPLFRLQDHLRDLLVGMGYLEAQTPAFAPSEEGEVEVRNPVSAEETHLRSSLLPALIRRVERNFSRGVRDVRLFELGTVFFATSAGEPPREESRLAVVLTGRREPPHWSRDDVELEIWDVKGLLEALRDAVGLDGTLEGGAPGNVHLDGTLGIHLRPGGSDPVGAAGRIRPERVDAPAWAGPVWGLELVLPRDPAPADPVRYRPPPSFPGVDRDLALLVPDALPSADVEEAIEAVAGEHLEEVEVFDLYRGEGIPEGSRSIAYRLHFRSPERTLTDDEVDAVVEGIVTHLREELGVEPRGP